MLHIGVDEVGYGPLLGPLVVGVAGFRLPDGDVDAGSALRRTLRGLVVRAPRNGRAGAVKPLPVPVDDSKAIYRRFGLAGLARGVGTFAAALDVAPPANLADLLCRFSDRQPEEFAALPWYGDLDRAEVPRYPWAGPLQDRFLRRGVEALDLRVLPLGASDYNAEIARTGNKAKVLGVASGMAVLSLLDWYPGEDAVIVFDRHGGRLDYTQYLADLFPFSSLTAHPAPHGGADYEIELPGRRLHVRFRTQADRVDLAVGWASMAAKLTRELFMERLNAWFLERLPGVKRTAGYVQDGRRFVDEVRPVVEAEGIDWDVLVRVR